ncbi:MAG: hypothetical protein ACOX9E_13310 [Lentisphaeria bacterium]|jgi:hypothetical protein
MPSSPAFTPSSKKIGDFAAIGRRLITDIFYPQMSQICADFFESRLLGAGRPVCLRFPVASLFFSAEGAKHTSPGQAALKARAALGGATLRNSTLKACHIADTKDGFHRKTTENSQLSIGDRLRFCGNRPAIDKRASMRDTSAR